MNPPELYDLHVHSTRSDGVRSPLELGWLAKRHGLAGIALSDHDVLPDIEANRHIEAATGVVVIAAVELTTHWRQRGLHLLGYGCDPGHERLRRACSRLLDARRLRWRLFAERLRERGIRLDPSRLEAIERAASPGRLHLARELVAARKATSVRAAFENFLYPLDEGADPLGIALAEAVELIHLAGGAAILAHPPFGLIEEEWEALAHLGLDGIEVRFGGIKRAVRDFLLAKVQRYGWIGTAGSDYHGEGSRNQLGLHTVDRSVLDALGSKRSFAVT